MFLGVGRDKSGRIGFFGSSGGTSGFGLQIGTVPTRSGRLASMLSLSLSHTLSLSLPMCLSFFLLSFNIIKHRSYRSGRWVGEIWERRLCFTTIPNKQTSYKYFVSHKGSSLKRSSIPVVPLNNMARPIVPARGVVMETDDPAVPANKRPAKLGKDCEPAGTSCQAT